PSPARQRGTAGDPGEGAPRGRLNFHVTHPEKSMKSDFNSVVLPGDGIGVEVIDATLAMLEPVQKRYGFELKYDRRPRGARLSRDAGNAFPDSCMKACESADAFLFGAMGWPDIRYPDGTEIAPQLDMRVHLDL